MPSPRRLPPPWYCCSSLPRDRHGFRPLNGTRVMTIIGELPLSLDGFKIQPAKQWEIAVPTRSSRDPNTVLCTQCFWST